MIDWSQVWTEATKQGAAAVEFAVAAALVAFFVDAVRRRRARRSMLQAVLLELLNNRDYAAAVPGIAQRIQASFPAGATPTLKSWTRGDTQDSAFARAWASDDTRVMKRRALAASLRNAYSGIAVFKETEAEVVRLLDRDDGEQAFHVLVSLANQAPALVATIQGAINVLDAEGIRLPG